MNSLKGPKGRLFTGNLREFRADRLAFFTRCAREFGDLVPMRILRHPILLLSRPDLIEQVLVAQAGKFVKHFGLRLYKPLLGEGLVTSEGDFWRRQRKLSAPAFVGARIAGYAPAMVRATSAEIEKWRDGQIRDVHEDLMRITLDIACKTLFGDQACPNPAVVGHAMEEAMLALSKRWERVIPLPDWLPTPVNRRFNRARAALDATVLAIIESRRQNLSQGDDLLRQLIEAQDETGSAMTDRQLLDEVRTIFLAGHETTALALAYSLMLLASHREAQTVLSEELDRVLSGREPTHGDLPALTYTRNIITESMRLYPPADVLGREAKVDCTIGEVPVPRGTSLFMSTWVMHRDPRYFPDPLTFNPARWTENFEKSLPRFAYFPFGGGPRFCIGQTFALTEAALALATICQRFEFQTDPGFKLELWPSLTLRPRNGIRLIVRERAKPTRSPAETLPSVAVNQG
jgi:cytochrome P450